MARRPVGVSDFDMVVQEHAGALQLTRIIHHEAARFQAAQSLYMQIHADKFDDAEDDQWAMALEAIRPGNVRHNLKAFKIEIVSDRLFEPYSVTKLPSSNMDNPYVREKIGHFPVASRSFFAERSFIKALSNIRGVERVEIVGPMEASLKKMLAAAMTTQAGHKVRDWRYGGGLRSEGDISWGSWSATMQATGEAAAYKTGRFDQQTFLPKQPMQIVTDVGFEPNGAASLITVRSSKEMARPSLPLDGNFGSSSLDGASSRDVDGLASNGDSKRADRHENEGGGMARKKARALSPSLTKSGQGHGNKNGSTEVVGMGPQPGQPPGDARGYTEAGGMQTEDDADVEMEDWEMELESIPSDDADDEDYQD
ncbi:uncharacterized protein BKCO1_3700018 [Diplodia corticola]|uniref:Uncharacterized protein n=1 Tax=Diplodia corticola TaxID=236234 RepID=A0A1J9RZ09_9PEZI|nr:uncharacterized protein BKCO1_3700018 [Diplodia corticola]OJD32685.1 hypothetical protein BKCO1_3700018 [Diplodia corticola]